MQANTQLLKGNKAIVLAALDAGCRFYAGYPITPQNEIPELMSYMMPATGGVFIQAESELMAVNMVFGAAVTGERSMTTSSSPGISLMQEGISYLAACELPCVLVNVQRGGPGLGNISPSQADYFQAVKPGHGDYRNIVLAPATIQEMYDQTFEAFDLADEYRVPVMILTDGLLGQMMEDIDLKRRKPEKKFDKTSWALTGAVGRPGRRINSLMMKPGELEAHNIKLAEKFKHIESREQKWEFDESGDYDYLVCAYGTTARIAKGALELSGLKAKVFRPKTLWPFPYDAMRAAAKKAKKVFVVEMSHGQFIEDVRLAVMDDSKIEFHGRAGGGVPTAEEIADFMKQKAVK